MEPAKIIEGKKWQWAGKIAVTAIFLYLANRSIRGSDLTQVWSKVTFFPVVLTLAFSIAGFLLQARRWQIILAHDSFPSGYRIALKTVLWGNTLAFITPGRVGEFLRGLEVDTHRKGDSVIAVIVEKAYIVGTTALIGLLCFAGNIFIVQKTPRVNEVVLLCMIILLALFVAAVFWKRDIVKEKHAFMKYIARAWKMFPRLYTFAGQRALLYSLLIHGILILQTALLFRMFGSTDMLVNYLAAGQAYAFMIFIPFSIANIGIREYSFALFLSSGAIAETLEGPVSSISLGASMMILGANIFFPAFVGLIWELVDSRGRGRDGEGRKTTRRRDDATTRRH
ncbi:MAG: hypothetical protein GF401_17455, partial [Chitinivibrionales bacterium]|nr:hypothetical protein [Chitinivibrionales bacterium]